MKKTIEFYNKSFKESKLYSVYPELNTETEEYLQLLRKTENKKEHYITHFEIPITTYGNESYLMKWDITGIINKIEKEKIRSIKIKVNHPMIWSCPSRLNFNKLNKLNKIPEFKKPIILAYHPSIQKLIVIDGNHRYNILKNRNQQLIDCIILHPKIHLEFVSEYVKNNFIIQHNLFALNNYILFPKKNKLKVDKSFEKDSIYPILNKKYKFNYYRRMKYLLKTQKITIPNIVLTPLLVMVQILMFLFF